MGVSTDAPSVATGAMAEEEEEVEDDGKTEALAKGGVTDLARTAGRTSLVREVGGTHLARGLEGSASRGSPTRQCGSPSSATTAKKE